MTRKRKFLPVLMLTSVFLMVSGCLEYKVVTQIMEDGSIRRTVTVSGDSAMIYEQAFPYFNDPTWEITTLYEHQDEHTTGEGEVFVLEARKTFDDVESLNEDIQADSSDSGRLNIRADLQVRFKWFYSLYKYSETYLMQFPFWSYRIQEFLTPSELRVYNAEEDRVYYDPVRDSLDVMTDETVPPVLSPEDSLRAEELREGLEIRYEEWAKKNLFDAFYKELEKAFISLAFVPGTGKQKENLYNWLDSTQVFEEIFEEDNMFLEKVAGYYDIDTARLHSANREGFDGFNRKIASMTFNLDSFTHQVLIPGMVVYTNAMEQDGNLVSWNFTTNDFYATDYTMTVRSSLINRWMIVVSATIVFLIVGILITSLVLKKKK